MTYKFNQRVWSREWPTSLTHDNDRRVQPTQIIDENNPWDSRSPRDLWQFQVLPKRLIGILSVFLAPFRCITQEVQKKTPKSIPFFAYPIIRSSRTVAFCKEGVLTKLAKFTRKYCCWILTFNEVANLQHATLSKRNSTTGDFMGTLWNFSDDVTYIFQLSTFTT